MQLPSIHMNGTGREALEREAMIYTIRRCRGNRQAWGGFNDDRDPGDYGHVLITSLSLDRLVAALAKAFVAPYGEGRIEPRPVMIEIEQYILHVQS